VAYRLKWGRNYVRTEQNPDVAAIILSATAH